MTAVHTIFLTGQRKIGKTSLLLDLVQQANTRRLDLAGVLSRGRFQSEVETGKFALDLRTRESRLLASKLPGELVGLELGVWTFSEDVLAWGNRCFLAVQTCDIFIVDEIGPLELERGQGWVAALAALEQVAARLALVVVRPECLPAMQQRLPQADRIELSQGTNRNQVVAQLLKDFGL